MGTTPPSSAAPARQLAARGGLVGRERELAALGARLGRGPGHVVLVGPPGVGKSCLAREAARRAFPMVIACDLAEARGVGDVTTAIATELGARVANSADADALHAVGASLEAAGPCVLVLDDVDGTLGSLDAVATELLAAAPELRVLSTSRTRAIDRAERFEVEPLALEAAVALFLERAPRAMAADELPAVRALAMRVDRLPLALELAAVHATVLRAGEILSRLDVLLAAEPGTGRGSLDAAVRSTWDQLSTAHRRALHACCVFRGGLSMTAAEAVIEGGPAAAVSAIGLLQRASLLAPQSSRLGETRWAPYDAVRTFVLARTDDEAARAAARERHRAHFVREAERWARAMRGPEAPPSRAHLLEEGANVLAAIEASRESHPEDAIRAAFALDEVLSQHATHDVELANLDVAVRASEACSVAWRARALSKRGWAQQRAGRGHAARQDLEDAVGLARESGDTRVLAETLWRVGHLHLRWMRLEAAGIALREALAITADNRHDEDMHAEALSRLGVLELELGEAAQAVTSFDRAAELHEATGDLRSAAAALSSGAVARFALGDHVTAQSDLDRALVLAETLDDRRLRAAVLTNLGLLDHEQGRLEAALARQDEAIALARRDAYLRAEATCERRVALVRLSSGDDGAARAALERAVAVARRGRFVADEGRALALLAIAAPSEAERSLGLAHPLLGAAAERLEPIVRGVISGDVGAGSAVREPATLAALGGLGSFAEVRLLARVGEDRARRRGVRAPVLEVAADGSWLRIGEGERVSLARRGAVRRLLAELARRRAAEPGVACDVHTLFETAWPGDKARPDFAAARVYESVRVLRKLGLRDVLLRREEGYLLDPAVTLELR